MDKSQAGTPGELRSRVPYRPIDSDAAAARIVAYPEHRVRAVRPAHHPEQQDCAVCPMPSRETADISHERVPAWGNAESGRWVQGEELVPVWDIAVGDREVGLAYAQRAQKGDKKAAERARKAFRPASLGGITLYEADPPRKTTRQCGASKPKA